MKITNKLHSTQCFVVLGAGPSGLATAYKLCELNQHIPVFLIEKSLKVGGLSSSFEWEECKVDYGPHRLSGGLSEITNFLKLLLGSNLKKVSLTHRVFFEGHFHNFPIHLKDLVQLKTLWFGFRVLTSLIFTKLKIALFRSQLKDFDTQLKQLVGNFLHSHLINEMLQKVWPGESKDYDVKFIKIRFSVVSFIEIIRVFIRSRGLNTTENYYPVGGYGTICEAMLEKVSKRSNFHFLPNSSINELFLNEEKNRVVGLSVISENSIQIITADDFQLVSSIPLNDLASLVSIHLESESESENKISNEPLEIVSIRLYCFLFDQDQTLEASTFIFPNQNPRVNRLFEQNLYERSSVPLGKSLVIGDLSFIHNSIHPELLPTPEEIFADLAYLNIFDKTKLLNTTFLDIPHAYLRPSQKNSIRLKELEQLISAIQNVHLIGRFSAGVYNNLDYAILSGFDLARWLVDSQETTVHGKKDWNNHHKIYG